MRRFIIIGLIAFGILGASNKALFAEERKTLEELLIEKGTITKEEAAELQSEKLSKWVDRITFYGDFRLRQENFMREDPNVDRSRQRFRLRMTTELKIEDFVIGVRLASGTGEQVSTNQSFDNLFSQKQLWIDRAYLQWRGLPWMTLTGGKMQNPFFWIYTTDLVWDEDVNPEGFAQNFTFKPSDQLLLFANFGQLILDEDSNDNNDQWLFGEQAGAQIGVSKNTKMTLAGAFYNYKNATKGSFGQNAVQDGNTRVPPTPPSTTATNILAYPFRVLDLTAEFATKIGSLPVAIQGDYVKNLADPKSGKDTGYQVGLRLGKASDPETWEFAYYYKLLEMDATVADIADSDFGNGGTNRKGHIVWGAYSVTKALQFKTKYFMTEVEDETLSPKKDDIKRLQVDLVMKF
ncbi:MAG: putative porin [Candidatus Manganitrophaceae bacterium]